MTHSLIVSTAELAQHLNDPNWLVVDCSFFLAQPEQAEQSYLQGHIPGALYAHLDRDLSAPVIPGKTGRHPLPTAEVAARRFGEMGIAQGLQVVTYDRAGAALAAGRLWWMLQWLGFNAAAVLDGGLAKWLAEGRPLQPGRETRPAVEFIAHPQPEAWVTADQVEQIRQDAAYRLIDVRASERYRGEAEPLDPVAGHIPGASNLPYMNNMAQDERFRSPAELREIYAPLTAGIPPENVVFYCGSGVTSVHSILSFRLAGLGQASLYTGSWSEWIAPRTRPIALGAQPG